MHISEQQDEMMNEISDIVNLNLSGNNWHNMY